ncbi:hypothetical protein JCM8547_008332 [Rhodosporidiobolus lusitaniae]
MKMKDDDTHEADAVFGNQGDNTVQYRSVGVFSTAILMSKVQLGLGILALPAAFSMLGIVAALLFYVFFFAVTGWCGGVVGDFKVKHPQVFMFGPIGGEAAGVAYFLYSVFNCGSAFLTISTALNAISLHATCTAVFVVVGVVVTWPVASISTLHNIRWFSWVGLGTLLNAVFFATIAIGIEDRLLLAPQTGPFDLGFVAFASPPFTAAMNAVANIFFCPSGPPFLCAGKWTASPALGTAGVLIKRIGYGIALPGLLFTACLFCHIPAKWLMVRLLRNSRHLSKKIRTHNLAWFSCTLGVNIGAYIIASAIPLFDGLVGLILAFRHAALLDRDGAVFFQFPGFSTRRTALLTFGVVANTLVLSMGAFLIGTYSSSITIHDDYASVGGRPWSCADNSNSS